MASPPAPSPSLPPWSDLPPDILKLLVAYLVPNLFDVLSFEGVCKSWRAAAGALRQGEEERIPHSPRDPCLPCVTFHGLLPDAPGGRGDDKAHTVRARFFYSLHNGRSYRLVAAEEPRNWVCGGSSLGWLLMMDPRADAFLFNPVTGARAALPSITTLPGVFPAPRKKTGGDGAAPARYICFTPVNRYVDNGYHRHTTDSLRRNMVRKLVLSSSPTDSSCIALVIYSSARVVAFARPGDESWSPLPSPWMKCVPGGGHNRVALPARRNTFTDAMYHEGDGRFYALSDDAAVVAIDFQRSGVLRPRPKPTVQLFAPPTKRVRPYYDGMYLVALPSGEILQVWRILDGDEFDSSDDDDDDDNNNNNNNNRVGSEALDSGRRDKELDGYNDSTSDADDVPRITPRAPARFDIFLLKVSGEKKKKKKWEKLASIGGHSLFLGVNQSMSLSASNETFDKCRPNCVYFADDMFSGRLVKGQRLGIFDVEKQTVQQLSPIDSSSTRIMSSLMWIMPSR